MCVTLELVISGHNIDHKFSKKHSWEKICIPRFFFFTIYVCIIIYNHSLLLINGQVMYNILQPEWLIDQSSPVSQKF